MTRIVSDLHRLAEHEQETEFKIPAPEALEDIQGQALTVLEVELLRWTMDGKSAREIAEIMRIADRLANLRLQSAMRKLGCASKHQAVLKAIRLGLLA